MSSFPKTKKSFLKRYQLPVSLVIVFSISLLLFYTVSIWGYRVPALVLLMLVSLFALIFDILTVVISAIVSALIWNFFFIPPLFTFHIANGEDGLMFLMYFIIALVHTALSYKIKEAEKIQREKDEKEKTIKLYNTLLNSLSHELKTPIATIIGAVDTIKENKFNLSDTQKELLISEIGIAGLRLNREVENLLSMSRLESGSIQLKLDWVDINEVICMAIAKLNELSQSHIIHFEVNETLPLLKLDAMLIEHVLYNLIHNAILYTPAGSQINILARVENEICILQIEDNGPGFPDSELPNIFKMFYRIPRNKTGGSGLGLSIVKGFVEAHGGNIQVVTDNRQGTNFVIQLPVPVSYLKNIKNE